MKYKIERYTVGFPGTFVMNDWLNAIADEGWEVVSHSQDVNVYTFVFKSIK